MADDRPDRSDDGRGRRPNPRPKGKGRPDSSGDRRRSGGKAGRRPDDRTSRDSRAPRPARPSSVGDQRAARAAEQPERDTSNDLPWPDEIFELELEPELRAEIEAFGGRTETLSKHLLSVQVLAESDPEAAYLHAARIRDRVPRAALGRQTACIAAYRTERFKEAIKEESAYRRISASKDLVPIAADSERGLGRPERALALVAQFDADDLDADTRTELLIVGGGARRDLGDADAARVLLQKAVRVARSPMATARARYALGELLAEQGESEQARKWLQSAADIDADGVWTAAAEMLEGM
jgi:tetratricopeptide (TPR) repeat protein